MASYDAWGVLETAAIAPFGFTGELQHGSDVWLRARWYGAGRGSFGSRDPFAGDAQTPSSLQYYQYGYSNPLLLIDPTGNCPTPPASWKKAICMALFIKPYLVGIEPSIPLTDTTLPMPFLLHGDGRTFQAHSSPTQLRGYIWIDVVNKTYQTFMNKTGYLWPSLGMRGPQCSPSFGITTRVEWAEPSWANFWWVDFQKGGTVKVSYDLVLGGLLEKVAPSIDGAITFYPIKGRDTTTYFAYGKRDGFPWAEAYSYDRGRTQTIFQRAAIKSDPENLNADDGRYPFEPWWWVAYGIRATVFARKNPQFDSFGYDYSKSLPPQKIKAP